MDLKPMLLPNLTQNKEVFYHKIPEEWICGSRINPRVLKMLFLDRSQYSTYCWFWDHAQNPIVFDNWIDPRPWLELLILPI